MIQQFITEEIEKAIKATPYGSTESIDKDEKKVIARYFAPWGGATWYVLEDDDYSTDPNVYANGNGKVVFGAVTLGYEMELGSFSLCELQKLILPNGLHIERDESVEPLKHTLGELMKQHGECW